MTRRKIRLSLKSYLARNAGGALGSMPRGGVRKRCCEEGVTKYRTDSGKAVDVLSSSLFCSSILAAVCGCHSPHKLEKVLRKYSTDTSRRPSYSQYSQSIFSKSMGIAMPVSETISVRGRTAMDSSWLVAQVPDPPGLSGLYEILRVFAWSESPTLCATIRS